LGYVEGQNLIIESRWVEPDRLSGAVAELVQLKVDVLLAGGESLVQLAKQATSTIPIVMIASDPAGARLVTSLARPGGNITGLTILSPELSTKRLEFLKEALPNISRVAVLYHPDFPSTALALQETQRAARALGVRLQLVEVHDPPDFEGAFAAMTREHAEALILLPVPLFLTHRSRISELAATSRLPAIYFWRDFAEAGGLMSYGPSLPELFRRAATYIDKIFKGAKPGDLPIEQPAKFELVINLKTALALGLTLPPTVLFLADEVIQ
jgi:putative ABC transport system substrate-binding protein